MKKPIRPRAIAIARKFPAASFLPDDRAGAGELSAAELGALSRRNLWSLLFFLLISVGAFSLQDFDLFAAVSEEFWPLLGSPPPPVFITASLAIYIFCALALLPDRLNNSSRAQNRGHLGYRTIFYLFYLTANSLAANFLVVFSAGLILYGLEESYLFLQMARNLRPRRGQ